MRPLFHLGERESSRIVFGLKRSIGKNKSQSNTFWTRKIFCYAKLNATSEFFTEIQREFSSWRNFQSDYKLFISLFWCHRLSKRSENGSEGLALVSRAGHPRKKIAIMSLVSSPADSKDHWLITITDEHLAKSRDGGFILTVIRQNWLMIKPWKNLVDAYMRSGAQPQRRKTNFILMN